MDSRYSLRVSDLIVGTPKLRIIAVMSTTSQGMTLSGTTRRGWHRAMCDVKRNAGTAGRGVPLGQVSEPLKFTDPQPAATRYKA